MEIVARDAKKHPKTLLLSLAPLFEVPFEFDNFDNLFLLWKVIASFFTFGYSLI
jgi:hypothetical protein